MKGTQVSKLLCKDCKHSFLSREDKILTTIFFNKPNQYAYKCKLGVTETHTEYNAVTGPERVQKHYDTCAYLRLANGKCGEEGKLWSPKHKKDLFLAITRGEA